MTEAEISAAILVAQFVFGGLVAISLVLLGVLLGRKDARQNRRIRTWEL